MLTQRFSLISKVPQRFVNTAIPEKVHADRNKLTRSEPPSVRTIYGESSTLIKKSFSDPNVLRLTGSLGRDAEVKTGVALSGYRWTMTTFSLATKRPVKNKDGTFDQATDWHKVVQFGPNTNDLKKGDYVEVTGSVTYSKLTPAWLKQLKPARDIKITYTNINAKHVKILKKKNAELPKKEEFDNDDD